ncbi:MAG: DUF3570 domain-containing protein [Reinekea sp.]
MSDKFRKLAKAAIAIPGMVATAQAAAPADAEASYRYTKYSEDDSPQSRDDSGGAQERYNINVHQFHLLYPLAEHWSVGVETSLETMAGASPVYSYIPDSEEDVYTHFAGASEETRFDVSANARRYSSKSEAGTALYFSKERDYTAINAATDGSFQINDQMTTFSGGVSYGHDWLNPTVVDSNGNVTNGNDLSDAELAELVTTNPASFGAIDGSKWQISAFEGIGQIINMNTVVQASVAVTYKDGYLSDPYRNCVGSVEAIAEDVPCDIRPSSRLAGTLSLGGRRFLPNLNSAVHLDYRLYVDTWDVLSNTLDLDYFQNYAPGWTFFTRHNIDFQFIPGLRYYQQTAAYFYEVPDLNDASGWVYTADTTEYYSSDPRLSHYGALALKFRTKADIKNFSVVSAFERYMTNPKLGFNFDDEIPGLPSYWRLTTGLDYRF